MLLSCHLLLVTQILLCQGLTEKLSPEKDFQELEKEFSADTDSCVEAARVKHKNNPNAGLDHFLNCLLKHVNTLQETKENQEIDELKTTLDEIENIPIFSNDGFNHNLVKRQAEEEEEIINDEEEISDEGRGWKKNGEKKKNKEKRNKKNKNKKKLKLQELNDEIEKEEVDVEKEMSIDQLENEQPKPKEPKVDPYTNGIQFSAYSGAPQPKYRPQAPRQKPEQTNKFLYSMDYQGNAQYMDEAAVSVLLQSPKAMKAMMDYLSKEQEEEEGQIPSRLREHLQRAPYPGYRVSESSLQEAKHPQDHYANRKDNHGPPPRPPRPSLPRPPVPRPQAPRPQKIPGFNTGPPKMEFFGPKDYVPEFPHLIQGFQMYQQSQRRIETPYPDKSNYLILEPKPRSLHRREAEEKSEFQHKFGFFPSLGRKKQPIQSKKGSAKKERTRVNMAVVESKELSEKEKTPNQKISNSKSKNKKKKERRRDKCKKCEDPEFSTKEEELCKKCKVFLEATKTVKCHLCEKKHYRRKNVEGCAKCNKEDSSLGLTTSTTETTTSTTTTITTSTTTITTTTTTEFTTQEPVTSSLSPNTARKSCRNAVFRRSNRETCKQALDKCRNKMYRTGNPTKCKEEEGDRVWLAKKCSTESFLKKNKDTCQRLCTDVAYRTANENMCSGTETKNEDESKKKQANKGNVKKQENENFESLEELVKKCGNKGYKKRNGDKCKVVETIDLVLVKDANKGKLDNEIIVSDVKILEGKVPVPNKFSSSDEKETNKKVEENVEYENPAIQKEDIVNAIKSKTEKVIEKITTNADKTELAIENEIQTYESSDIISSEKVKKKKDKKKKDIKKNKKEQKTKEIMEKKKQRDEKKKLKAEKGDQEKLTKSNCNKPKYAAKNPNECKGLVRMDNVLAQKCKKEKYKKKHKERCKDLAIFVKKDTDLDESSKILCQKPKYKAGHPEECGASDVFVLEDVRCKKDAFRRNYPELCTTGIYEDDILTTDSSSTTEDPDWLEDRCKHEKFRNRHQDLCIELCKQKKFAKLYRDICHDDAVETSEVNSVNNGEDQNSIIEDVINDIKDIVSKETTRQTTESKSNAAKSTTGAPSSTTKIPSRSTTAATTTTTTTSNTTTTTSTTTSTTTETTTTVTHTTTSTTTTTTTTSATTDSTTASTTTGEETTAETTPQTTPKPTTSASVAEVIRSETTSIGSEEEEETTTAEAEENLPRNFSVEENETVIEN